MDSPNQLEEKYNQFFPESGSPSAIQKPQKTWAIVLAVLVGTGLVVAGVWAYRTYYMRAPELKIKQAFAKTAQASFAFEGTFAGTIPRDSKYDDYLNLAGGSGGNTSSTEQIAVRFNGAQENIGKDTEAWFFSILATSPAEKGVVVGLDMRWVAKNLYAKLADETKITFFDLEPYKNIWISLDFDKYLEVFGMGAPFENVSSSQQDKQTLDEIRTSKMKEMVQNANLLTVNSISSKKIGDVSVVVYTVTFKKENLQQLIVDMAAFDSRGISQRQLESITTGLAELKDISGEITIGKKDGLVHAFKLQTITIKDEVAALDVVLKDFNLPLQLVEPASSISVEELLEQFFGGLSDKSSTSSASADTSFGSSMFDSQQALDTDKDGLTDSAEAMYGTDPNKVDTDNDGINDLDELMSDYDPVGSGRIPTSVE